MDLSAPTLPQDEFTAEMAFAMATQENVGGFLTHFNLLDLLGKDCAQRLSFDVVSPRLYVNGSNVCISKKSGESSTLFSMDSPLIEQIIHLKPFVTPENFDFFKEWCFGISQRTSNQNGWNLLFGGSTNAELWFSQALPTIEMSDPLPGVMQTLKESRR